MKLTAFGIKAYCKNNWNLFDGIIVILSMVDMALTYSKTISGAGLSVLRTFRLVGSTAHYCIVLCAFNDVVRCGAVRCGAM